MRDEKREFSQLKKTIVARELMNKSMDKSFLNSHSLLKQRTYHRVFRDKLGAISNETNCFHTRIRKTGVAGELR